jgi:hypothetical protein
MGQGHTVAPARVTPTGRELRRGARRRRHAADHGPLDVRREACLHVELKAATTLPGHNREPLSWPSRSSTRAALQRVLGRGHIRAPNAPFEAIGAVALPGCYTTHLAALREMPLSGRIISNLFARQMR